MLVYICIYTYIHIQEIVDIYIYEYIHASYTIYKHHVDSDAINSCPAIMACHVDWDQPLRRCKCHRDGGFPKTRGTPKSSKSWDVFSIETHGDLEIPRFRTPDHVNHLTLGDKCYPTRSLEIARWMISWKIPRKNGWWWMMMDDDW